MNIRIIHHGAYSLTREAGKVARVFNSLGYTVSLEHYLTADPTRDFDFNVFVGAFERYAIRRFDGCRKIVFYVTIEGRHNWSDFKPSHPIIAVSKFARDMLELSGYTVEGVVYHGFDLNWFNLSGANRPRLFGARQMWLLHKIWTPRQRVDLIVEALRLVKDRYNVDVSLLDLGRPPLSAYLGGRYPAIAYFLMPYLSDEFVVGSYKASDLYIHLSTSEGFGLTPLEALGCGVPTIYVDAPPMNELLPQSYGYRVRPIREEWLNVHPYEEFDFREFVFDPGEAADVLLAAYERRNHVVDRDYIRGFDMFKLYPRLLEWV